MNRTFLGSVIAVVVAFSIIPVIPLVIAFLAGIIVKRRINGDDNVPRKRTVDGELYGKTSQITRSEEGQRGNIQVWEDNQRPRERSTEYIS